MRLILHCIFYCGMTGKRHLERHLGLVGFWHLPCEQDRGLHHSFHTKVFSELCRGGENKRVTACHRFLSPSLGRGTASLRKETVLINVRFETTIHDNILTPSSQTAHQKSKPTICSLHVVYAIGKLRSQNVEK